MRPANNNNPASPVAPRICFLCETVGRPFLLADCRGEDVTICTPLCLERHGLTLPLTEAALTPALVGEVV